MPSRESLDIAELFIASDNTQALARSIDELRVRDLEAVAKSGYTWGGVQNYVEQQIAALKSTMGDEGRTA